MKLVWGVFFLCRCGVSFPKVSISDHYLSLLKDRWWFVFYWLRRDWEVRGKEIQRGQAARRGESHLISRHAGRRALDLFQAPCKGVLTAWVMLTASPQRERECQAREMKHVSLSPSTHHKWMAQHLAISDVPIWGKNGRVEFDVINHHNLLQFPKTNMTGWNYFAVLRQSFAEAIKCQYKSEDEMYLIWRNRAQYQLSILCLPRT